MSTRSKSSSRWLAEHFSDEYVKRARKAGWRSRAVFKLDEIQQKDTILKPGRLVIDLGSAPGSWSQYAKGIVGASGQIIAMDILPMEPIPGITFLQEDFATEEGHATLLRTLQDRPADLVMSDMAPNISGMGAVDQPRAMYLAELTLALARETLGNGGDMLVKLFQGAGFEAYVKDARKSFDRVLLRKPRSSRARSREIYLLARNYRI